MLLKTTRKRCLAALLALSACVMLGARRPALSAPSEMPRPADALAAGAPETLRDALAAAKREGFALTAQDLQAPLPPPEQNAAPLYTELARLQRGLGNTPEMPPEGMPTEAQFTAIRAALAVHQNDLDMIHQAAARPRCVFLRDWAQPASVTFPEYAFMRAAARWLAAESLLLLHDGKPLEAVRVQALGFAIARHTAQDPTPMAYYVAIPIQLITLRGMQNILLAVGTNAAVASAVRAAVEQNRAGFDMTHGLHGELAMLLIRLESLRRDYPKDLQAWQQNAGTMRFAEGNRPALLSVPELGARIDRSKLLIVQRMRRIAAAGKRPYLEAQTVLRTLGAAIEIAPPHGPVEFYDFSPSPFLRGPEYAARLKAQEECARAMAALLIYKSGHGAFPDSLKAALAPVPADPFGTGPLGYRREGAGFVLYSVGKTGKYDGTAEPAGFSQETVARYPRK